MMTWAAGEDLLARELNFRRVLQELLAQYDRDPGGRAAVRTRVARLQAFRVSPEARRRGGRSPPPSPTHTRAPHTPPPQVCKHAPCHHKQAPPSRACTPRPPDPPHPHHPAVPRDQAHGHQPVGAAHGQGGHGGKHARLPRGRQARGRSPASYCHCIPPSVATHQVLAHLLPPVQPDDAEPRPPSPQAEVRQGGRGFTALGSTARPGRIAALRPHLPILPQVELRALASDVRFVERIRPLYQLYRQRRDAVRRQVGWGMAWHPLRQRPPSLLTK